MAAFVVCELQVGVELKRLPFGLQVLLSLATARLGFWGDKLVEFIHQGIEVFWLDKLRLLYLLPSGDFLWLQELFFVLT